MRISMRWFWEVLLITVMLGLVSFFSNVLAFSAVQISGIVIPLLAVLLFLKIPQKFKPDKLLNSICIAFAFTAFFLFIVMVSENNYTNKMSFGLTLLQLEIVGAIAGNSFLFIALLSNKSRIALYFQITAFALLISVIYYIINIDKMPYCKYCQFFLSKYFLLTLVLLLQGGIVLLLRINKESSIRVFTNLIGLSSIINSLSVTTLIVNNYRTSSVLLISDFFKILSLYLLYKAFKLLNTYQVSETAPSNRSDSEQLTHVQERVEDLNMLCSNINDILIEHDIDRLLDKTLNHAIALLHAIGGEIGILDPKRNIIKIVASQNSISNKGALIPIGIGVIGMAVSRKEPIIIQKEFFDDSNSEKSLRYIAVPLIADTILIGALMVVRKNHLKNFSDEDINLLSLFSQQAAITLRNTQLLEDAQKRAETDSLTGLGTIVIFSTLQAMNLFVQLDTTTHLLQLCLISITLKK